MGNFEKTTKNKEEEEEEDKWPLHLLFGGPENVEDTLHYRAKVRRYELGQTEAEAHRFSDFSAGSFHIDHNLFKLIMHAISYKPKAPWLFHSQSWGALHIVYSFTEFYDLNLNRHKKIKIKNFH
jgi:hypothetical protein